MALMHIALWLYLIYDTLLAQAWPEVLPNIQYFVAVEGSLLNVERSAHWSADLAGLTRIYQRQQASRHRPILKNTAYRCRSPSTYDLQGHPTL